jgi:cobalt-zinc-cadmium efflux system outer membrane protein
MLYKLTRSFALFVAVAAQAKNVSAQDTTSLTLPRARALARSASAEVAAARYTVEAARARARQAGAFINPVLSYGREQTDRSGESTSQDIIAVDQTVEAPGVRSARRDAARLRTSLAGARLLSAEALLDLEVTRAYVQAIAAGRRASLADQAAQAFAAAARISERRLREGDISGFAARRIRLETARYAVMRAEAILARSTARLTLATLIADAIDPSTQLREPVADFTVAAMSVSSDSLVAMALRSRPELAAGGLEVDVATVETRLASRERLPSATLTFGSKREEVIGGDQLGGFVAGLSVPLPLWDRRSGAVGAGEAETRRRAAELAGVRRRVTREVTEGVEALSAVQEQLRVLGPDLQSDAMSVLRSAQLAYAEGELSLIEWLDTVRAYYETQTSIVNLRAELLVRAAALERAVGTSLFQELR